MTNRGADVPLCHLAEVIAIDSQHYRYREYSRTLEQGGDKKLPVILSSFFLDPQNPHRFDKGSDMVKLNL